MLFENSMVRQVKSAVLGDCSFQHGISLNGRCVKLKAPSVISLIVFGTCEAREAGALVIILRMGIG